MNFNDNYLLCVRCMTYNHSEYIKDALDGFCMQRTKFPFYTVVFDDASTDGEQEVIKSYMERHFELSEGSGCKQWETEEAVFVFARHKENENCYFLVVYLKKNLYKTPRKDELIKEWCVAKYIALCEGDDYWTDPLKIQKQVDYLENYEGCCMTACASDLEEDGKIIKTNKICEESRDLVTEEVILGGGGYMATASLVYNNEMLNKDIPKWRKMASVGDYPLQIQGTLVGRLHYFPEAMCVHRAGVEGSWTNTYLRGAKELTQIHRQKEVMWMKELDRDTNHKYQHAIYQHLREYFPVLYRKRMVSTRDYFRSVRVAGGREDYHSMIKNIIKRILNHHYYD